MQNAELAEVRRHLGLPMVEVSQIRAVEGYPVIMLEGVVAKAIDQLINRGTLEQRPDFRVRFKVRYAMQRDDVAVNLDKRSRFYWEPVTVKVPQQNICHTTVWVREPLKDGGEDYFAPIGFGYYMNRVLTPVDVKLRRRPDTGILSCSLLRLL